MKKEILSKHTTCKGHKNDGNDEEKWQYVFPYICCDYVDHSSNMMIRKHSTIFY